MDGKEFSEIAAGITAAKLAELTGKSVSTIQSYLSGRSIIPYEISKFALALKKAFNALEINKVEMNNMRDMKRVIDGKLYNTKSAVMLGSYDNNMGNGDHWQISEELYRTKSGKYFFAGDGGAFTRYSESCGQNSRCSGENIIPTTEEEARQWMENHASADAYIAAFGEPPEA